MLQRLHAGSSLSLITDDDDDYYYDANVCSAARRSLHALAGSVSTAGRDTRLASGDCSRIAAADIRAVSSDVTAHLLRHYSRSSSSSSSVAGVSWPAAGITAARCRHVHVKTT